MPIASIETFFGEYQMNTGRVQCVPGSKQIPSQNGVDHGEMPLDEDQGKHLML